MKSALRPYQNDLYTGARQALQGNKSVCVQLATGGGKTPVMASMCESVYTKDKRAWIIVPRKELLNQASNHLRKWGVPHGLISAGNNESRAYKIQVVSSDTLIRRFNKIKEWPLFLKAIVTAWDSSHATSTFIKTPPLISPDRICQVTLL